MLSSHSLLHDTFNYLLVRMYGMRVAKYKTTQTDNKYKTNFALQIRVLTWSEIYHTTHSKTMNWHVNVCFKVWYTYRHASKRLNHSGTDGRASYTLLTLATSSMKIDLVVCGGSAFLSIMRHFHRLCRPRSMNKSYGTSWCVSAGKNRILYVL